MDFTDQQLIKEYCLEALEITEQYGIHEGLSYLIGEKFYLVHRNLQKAKSQARFVYEHERKSIDGVDPIAMGGDTFKLNYALTVSENYRLRLARIRVLEKTQKQFIQEIKDFFELHDILEYLNTYPRLGPKQSPHDNVTDTQNTSLMTAKNVFAEVDDILNVESMKKQFTYPAP